MSVKVFYKYLSAFTMFRFDPIEIASFWDAAWFMHDCWRVRALAGRLGMLRIIAGFIGAVAVLAFGSGAAFAVPTGPISDELAVYNPDGSLSQSVTLYESGIAWISVPGIGLSEQYPNQTGEGLVCPGQCYTAGFGAANPALAGSPTLILLEGANFSLSDYVGTYIDPTFGATFYFASDANEGPEFGPHINIGCVAVAGHCDITDLLAPSLIDAGFTATFFSNGDVRVPEPITLSLFGAGLAGVAAMRRRRKASLAG